MNINKCYNLLKSKQNQTFGGISMSPDGRKYFRSMGSCGSQLFSIITVMQSVSSLVTVHSIPMTQALPTRQNYLQDRLECRFDIQNRTPDQIKKRRIKSMIAKIIISSLKTSKTYKKLPLTKQVLYWNLNNTSWTHE